MSTFGLSQSRKSANLFLLPNANGCHTGLTPVGAANNWDCVNDPRTIPDNDATYVKSNAVSLVYDLYVLPNHTTEIGTINYIQVFSRAKSHEFSQHEDGIYKILITDNACANIYKSNDINLTASSYATYSKVWTTNPRTANAWTWNNIDNLQIGSECSSPTLIDQTKTLVIYPNGDGGQCGTIRPKNPDGASTNNWSCVLGVPNPDCYAYIIFTPFLVDTWYCDHYLMGNHSGIIGTEPINYVIIKNKIQLSSTPDEGIEHKAKTLLVTNATDYYGNEVILEKGNVYITTQYTGNPFTSSSWTWNEINLLMGGFSAKLADENLRISCFDVEILVNYDTDINPEIRTTQCYAKINYQPPGTECILNKPKKISVDHTENVKMLNFWDGTREVYGLNRTNKSMVLTGSEYQSSICNKSCPCKRITCVKEMGKDGSTITISGLRSLFNGDFKIRSFGWKHISEKPECYDWILELEYDD